MGFQVRKRSKGKNGWLNFSYSEKNGLGISVSAKAGPFTWNSGNGKSTRRRLTTDLGNGVRHVSYAKKPRPLKQSAEPDYTYTKPWDDSDSRWVGTICVAIILSSVAFGFIGFFGSILIGFILMVYKVNFHD